MKEEYIVHIIQFMARAGFALTPADINASGGDFISKKLKVPMVHCADTNAYVLLELFL